MKGTTLRNAVIGLSIVLLTASPTRAARPFSSVPEPIYKKFEQIKRAKSREERIKLFESAVTEANQLEKDLKLDTEDKKGIDTLALFQVQEMFLQVKRQGFKPEACKKSLRLMPFWADPTLTDIKEAHEPARFTYELVKEICK